MAAFRSGNEERAWNDPPVFAFDSSQGAPPKRSVLSGRIRHPPPAPSAGPLGSLLPDSTPSPDLSPSDEPHSPVILLPPTTTTAVPPICPIIQPPSSDTGGSLIQPPKTSTTSTKSQDGVESLQDSESFRLETLRLLERALETCQQKPEDRVVADVRRRLALLSSNWKEGKLSPTVQVKMRQLAEGLSKGDVETAHSLHLSLMVDYVSEVSQWMVGIKHLIRQALPIKEEAKPPT